MKYVYHGKLQEIQRYGHFNFISKVQSFLMGLYLNKVAKLVKLYNWVKGLNQPFFDTKTESYDFWGHRAQCVELKSRWQVCVHASTWPESYFQAKFWIFFYILNTRSWLRFAQKRIWNTLKEIFIKKVKEYNFSWQFPQ